MNTSAKKVSDKPGNTGLVLLATVAVLFAAATWGPAAPPDSDQDTPLELKMPNSLHARHEAFHAEFVKATQETGKVGDAARAIEKVGATHFAKAKDAFAPLGLLPQLAEGKVTPEMRVAIQKAKKLRSGLPQIHGEHRELVAGLKRLAEAAKEEGKTDYVRFTERLTLHIQEEEEVLYPAVLLVGDSVKWRLDKQ
ncbi:MAG: hemerythrin domain-containing protein [Planctomycetia bacterium]|nr:hemerythrin domain-containing protein [Planctomycetia bacterium]